jgi:hypothetical protein
MGTTLHNPAAVPDLLMRTTAIRAHPVRSRFRIATQLRRNRGGGTGGECPMLQNEKSTDAYSKSLKSGAKPIARGAQIMSIFGVGDRRSDFFSESFPLLTAWQSEHG